MAPCAPLRLLSQRDLGGGVVVLEPAGLGLLLDGEREGGRLSLSLSLQGGAGGGGDDRGGGVKRSCLRDTHLTRKISLTSEQPGL